jgi:predicted O-methyltransferase YrrM
MLNVRHGGWDDRRAAAALKQLAKFYEGKIDLVFLRG